MPGPPKTPTRLKALAGNPGKRPLNNDPEFTGHPVMPDWLNKEARREWKRVLPDLLGLDLIRSVDSASFASYCQSYARWKQAEELIEAEGVVIDEPIVSKSGDVVGSRKKKHPAQAISKDAEASMHRAAAQFGFSPASRTRISVPDKAPEDAFATFMSRRNPHGREETKPC